MSDQAAEYRTKESRVVIVGGGLAGLAAAVALSDSGFQVTLLEAKQSLGGRAGSYRDPESGELIDHCQHVAMGCCTNYLDLCRRTKCDTLLQQYQRLHFLDDHGVRSDFASAHWLPAPLHLVPALLGLKYLNWRDKWAICRAMFALIRLGPEPLRRESTIGQWLQQMRQTPAAIERFWKVVLVSALGESLERASLAAAHKVFVDGFLSNTQSGDLYIPLGSLAQLYDQRITHWLEERGVNIQLGAAVKRLAVIESGGVEVITSEQRLLADVAIVAVPWRRLPELLNEELAGAVPQLSSLAKIESSPISSIHLWTDRAITELPHAVVVDRLSQWVFAGKETPASAPQRFYYQVVISASRELAGRDRQNIIDEVWNDLRSVFPTAREASLLSAQLITQREAVFSVRPGLDAIRPSQRTNSPKLVLAGDWTATGWPATMEGAVRSGYLAASEVEQTLGSNVQMARSHLQPDLPRGLLARLLIR